MTFIDILTEAVAVTNRLALRSGHSELQDVATLAARHLDHSPATSPSICPLEGVRDITITQVDDETANFVNVVFESFDELSWFRSSKVPTDFVTASAAAEFIGPDGRIPSDQLRFGLFLIDKDTSYQRHWHAAEEHYMLLAGQAEWNLNDGWRRHLAGEVVQITSLAPHAIRTTDHPVLMLYSWTGDVTFDTYGY